MDSVNSIGRRPENCYAERTCAKPASSAQSTELKVAQSRSSDITLVTAEGDTVTLSASRSTELSFETYGSTGASAEIRKNSEFSLTVEGDLNKEELKDIRKAIKTLYKAERDLLKGHDERAADRTAKLANLDQLASIDAKMESSQTVSVTQTSVQTPASEPQPAIEPPAEPPVTETPAVAPAETPQLPSPVQQFTVATFDKQQQFTFQYLWDAGRPLAVQVPGVEAAPAH